MRELLYALVAPRSPSAAATALHKAMSGGTTVDKGFNEAQLEAEALFKKAGYIK